MSILLRVSSQIGDFLFGGTFNWTLTRMPTEILELVLAFKVAAFVLVANLFGAWAVAIVVAYSTLLPSLGNVWSIGELILFIFYASYVLVRLVSAVIYAFAAKEEIHNRYRIHGHW